MHGFLRDVNPDVSLLRPKISMGLSKQTDAKYDAKVFLLHVCASILISFIVDKQIIPYFSSHGYRLYHALTDSICHGILSVSSWLCFSQLNRHLLEGKYILRIQLIPSKWIQENIIDVMLSYVCGSFIDSDHFIAAGALSFAKATNLSSRPIGHCFMTLALLSIIVGLVRPHHWKKNLIMLFLGYTSHMIRDGSRRGLWLVPSYITAPIPYFLHLAMLSFLPFIVATLLNRTCISGMNKRSTDILNDNIHV